MSSIRSFKFIRSGISINRSTQIMIRRYHHFRSIRQIQNQNDIKKIFIQLQNRNLCSNHVKNDEKPNETMLIFDKIKPLITDDLRKSIKAQILFVISGKNYFVDVSPDRPVKIEMVDQPPSKVDLKVICDDTTFSKLVHGKMQPLVAFMSKKIKFEGNQVVAVRANQILSLLKKQIK